MSTTRSRKRPSTRRPATSVAKPRGVLHPRVQQVGPEHFGIVCFDGAKARSKFLLADFYGRVLIPPTTVAHNRPDLDAEGKPVLAAKPTEHVCEKCGSKMILREGRRGPFLACSGYPKCKNAKDVDAEGNPIKPIDTGIQCEKCGSAMTVKRGPRGPFLGCSAYPKCRSTKPMPPDLKEKLKDLLPAPKKPTTPAVEVHETCPDCGAPMKLRNSRRGFFLGCSKYPKCKGTREAPPELLEQLQPSAV